MKRLNGLNRDTSPIDQPAGTYRYAKNAIIDIKKMAIVSEKGDREEKLLDDGENIVGHIVLDDDDIVLFTIDNVGTSKIGRWRSSTTAGLGTYTVLFTDLLCNDKLNFSVDFPIEGEYKIDATDDVTVYWTDDNNPPRFMNLTTPPTCVGNPLLDIEVTFDIFPKIGSYPKVMLNKVTNGGTLNVGTYYFTLQFVSENGATTNVLDISNPIYINPVTEGLADSPFGVAENYAPNGYGGADAGTTSGKKIVMDVRHIDTSYSSVRPIFIQQVSGVRTAVQLPDKPITGTIMTIQYTGYEDAEPFTLADVQIPRASYTKAKTVAQVDDVLYLGNLVRTRIDIGYQKFANSIIIESVQLDPNAGANDSPTGSHTKDFAGITVDGLFKTTTNNQGFGRSAYDNYYFKGYDRDEVYAFYITWILKDGSESMAYHIPGRAPLQTTMQNGALENDLYDSVVNNDDEVYLGDNVAYAATGMTAKMFHLTTEGSTNPAANKMGYWENANESYPIAANDPNNDFQVWTVDALGNSVPVGNIQGQKVRHHHFPAESIHASAIVKEGNNKKANFPFVSLPAVVSGQSCTGTRADQGGGFIWDGAYTGAGYTTVYFNPMGFKAYNIPFPEEIRELVLGYKIYYANRTSENATVIDHGMISEPGRGTPEGDSIIIPLPTSTFNSVSLNDPGDKKTGSYPVFDGYHSLVTGDSIEAANVFKGCRYHNCGDSNGAGTAGFHKGMSHFTVDDAGQNMASTRSSRIFIDYCRLRPSEYLAQFDYQGYNTAGRLLNYNGPGNTSTYGNYIVPLAGKAYLPAGGADNVTIPGSSVQNDSATQTIILNVFPIDRYLVLSDNLFNFAFHAGIYNIIPVDNAEATDAFEPSYENHNGAGLNAATDDRTSTVFGNLYAIRDDVYSNFEEQTELVYTGHLYRTSGLGAATVINPTAATAETVMGGDTFLGMIGITKMRMSNVRDVQVGNYDGNDVLINKGTHLGHSVSLYFGENVLPVYDHATHLFPTSSRSHIAMRERDPEDKSSAYFPAVPNRSPLITKGADLHYQRDYDFNDDYNAEGDVKIIIPYNYKDPISTLEDFPTRIIRSIKYNQSGLTDNFRVFLSNQFRDLPRHRGELWRLEAMRSLLVPHMERSLMLTRGKEELAVGAVAASLGSGDFFERDPSEVITTERGYGGTQSQWAGVVTTNGYFFVDIESKRCFMFTDKLEDITMGMFDWFQENMKQPLWDHGLPVVFDKPTLKIGATAGYDPQLDRIIFTYHYLEPTKDANFNFNNYAYDFNKDNNTFEISSSIASQGANANAPDMKLTDSVFFEAKYWTISYYPAMKAWGSFHDYEAIFYPYTNKKLYKLQSNVSMYSSANLQHDRLRPGYYTGQSDIKPFVFEFIDNTGPQDNKLFSSINWTIDVEEPSQNSEHRNNLSHNPGFSHIYAYNSEQMSRESALVSFSGAYSLNANTRRNERGWYFNDFRDDALLVSVPGSTIEATPNPQFTHSGMDIDQNVAYLDITKPFNQRKKFIDKYLGVRLTDKSIDRKIISLYLTDTSKRKSYR